MQITQHWKSACTDWSSCCGCHVDLISKSLLLLQQRRWVYPNKMMAHHVLYIIVRQDRATKKLFVLKYQNADVDKSGKVVPYNGCLPECTYAWTLLLIWLATSCQIPSLYWGIASLSFLNKYTAAWREMYVITSYPSLRSYTQDPPIKQPFPLLFSPSWTPIHFW